MTKILKDNSQIGNRIENIRRIKLTDILSDMNFNMNLLVLVLIIYCLILVFTHIFL